MNGSGNGFCLQSRRSALTLKALDPPSTEICMWRPWFGRSQAARLAWGRPSVFWGAQGGGRDLRRRCFEIPFGKLDSAIVNVRHSCSLTAFMRLHRAGQRHLFRLAADFARTKIIYSFRAQRGDAGIVRRTIDTVAQSSPPGAPGTGSSVGRATD